MLKITAIVTPDITQQQLALNAIGRIRVYLAMRPEQGKINYGLITFLATGLVLLVRS